MHRCKLLTFVSILLLALVVLIPTAAFADDNTVVGDNQEIVPIVSVAIDDTALVDSDAVSGTNEVTEDSELVVVEPSPQEPSPQEPSPQEPNASIVDDGQSTGGEDQEPGQLTEPVKQDSLAADDGVDEQPVVVQVADDELKITSSDQAALDAFAAAHEYDISAGTYAIKSGLGNNLVVDVDHAGTANGTSILVWEHLNAANQRWTLTSVGGGYFTISSVSSGKYLDISGGDSKAGLMANIVQWGERNDGLGQRWVISRESDGYKFTSAVLGVNGERYVLDVNGGVPQLGAKLILWLDKETSTANQRWSFYVTDAILDTLATNHKSDIADGTYFLSSELGKNLVLDIEYASRDNSASAIVWPKNPSANEGWVVTHNAKGYLTITNALSGKVLDVCGGNPSIGADIIQWMDKRDGSRNQQWIAIKESDGTYRLTSALPFDNYLVLDVYAGEAKPKTKTILWVDKGDGAPNQHWTFSKAPEQYAYAHSIADGTYTIRASLDVSKTLDVYQALNAADTKVILWVSHGAGAPNQKWIVSHDNQGYAHLVNQNSNKELGFSDEGIAVQVAGSFSWVIEPQSDGTYRFRAATGAYSGKYLDADHARTDNGTTVLAWESNSGSNQKWVIRGGKASLIALDPGHGGGDSGATANGLRECDLTWSITQACAERLRSYGYDVYITMSEAEFKHSGSTVSVASRVQRAADAGASSIFSLHINAGGGHGAVTLVPNNSSYHYELYQQGQQFANILLPKINSLGIGTWNDGAWERNYSTADGAETNQFYEGGGFQDYYGIVRYARLRGMLGIIIEHGFIDSSDSNLLRQPVVQTKLGQADADAIHTLYI